MADYGEAYGDYSQRVNKPGYREISLVVKRVASNDESSVQSRNFPPDYYLPKPVTNNNPFGLSDFQFDIQRRCERAQDPGFS